MDIPGTGAARAVTFLRRLGEFARKNGYDSNAGGATEGGVVAPPFLRMAPTMPR